jgi:hypothetical protein
MLTTTTFNSNKNQSIKYLPKAMPLAIEPGYPRISCGFVMPSAGFLATPLDSAWAWHGRQNEPTATREEAPITQRLPVEIIAVNTQPKWVPIDPGCARSAEVCPRDPIPHISKSNSPKAC